MKVDGERSAHLKRFGEMRVKRRCSPSNVRPSAFIPLPFIFLVLLALACGAPYGLSGVTAARSVPYWACATPAPEDPGSVLITPTPEGPPYWATVEPPPTATPFYRVGEFYVGEAATVDTLQFRLMSLQVSGGYTLARLAVTNRGSAQTVVPLSMLVFAQTASGEYQGYSQAGQVAAGLPDPATVETTPVPGGGTLEETVAIAGEHTRIGLITNLFGLSGGGAEPIWLNASADPLSCPHGEAAWPVPPPDPGGYGYLGPLVSARPDVPGGEVPVEHYVYVSQGYSWSHHGIDLSVYAGEPIYTPIAGTVYFAGWNDDGYGNLVIVRAEIGQGDYLFMYFAHMLETPLVLTGDTVHCGQNIGFVGSTGHSTGPHLHWETRRGSDAENSAAADALSPEDTRVFWPSLCAQGEGR